jgi:phosphohistidine phosphatase
VTLPITASSVALSSDNFRTASPRLAAAPLTPGCRYRGDVARTLVLIRHAKAVGDATPDIERTLAPRGRRDAGAMGRWLARHDVVPDQVVVSPARRAVQTWEMAAAELAAAPPISIDDRVYVNTFELLLAVAHDSAGDVTTLAIVGHNPAMHAFAVVLADGHGDERALADLAEGFPTSGIAILDVEGQWADLAVGSASLRAFAAPRG